MAEGWHNATQHITTQHSSCMLRARHCMRQPNTSNRHPPRTHQERPLRAPRHRLAVRQHVLQRDRQRGVVAVHHHAGGVAHQQDVHAGAVDLGRGAGGAGVGLGRQPTAACMLHAVAACGGCMHAACGGSVRWLGGAAICMHSSNRQPHRQIAPPSLHYPKPGQATHVHRRRIVVRRRHRDRLPAVVLGAQRAQRDGFDGGLLGARVDALLRVGGGRDLAPRAGERAGEAAA